MKGDRKEILSVEKQAQVGQKRQIWITYLATFQAPSVKNFIAP